MGNETEFPCSCYQREKHFDCLGAETVPDLRDSGNPVREGGFWIQCAQDGVFKGLGLQLTKCQCWIAYRMQGCVQSPIQGRSPLGLTEIAESVNRTSALWGSPHPQPRHSFLGWLPSAPVTAHARASQMWARAEVTLFQLLSGFRPELETLAGWKVCQCSSAEIVQDATE